MSIIAERDGPVAIITINRPQARNAVDPATAQALYDALCDAEREEAVLATVLTGAEGAFCAGADLKAVAKASGPPPKRHPQQAPMGPTRLLADRDAPEEFVSLSKPMIAAIEGHAVAGGLELALMADMRVASGDGDLRRLLPALGRAADRWRDAAPAARDRTGARDGHDPHRSRGGCAGSVAVGDWPIVVVKPGEARAAAVALAKEIARFPQLCLRADRASAYAGWSRGLDEGLKAEARRGAPVVAKESTAGAARFAAARARRGLQRDLAGISCRRTAATRTREAGGDELGDGVGFCGLRRPRPSPAFRPCRS